MAVLNLNSFKAIQSNLFVKITLTASTLLFSDRIQSTTIAGDTYVGLGNLLSISGSNSELRSSSQELTLSISGVPNSSITDILASGIKGTPVIIRRGLFNATTGAFLSDVAGNPIIRFTGFVNNLGFDEEYDLDTRTSSNTIILTCASNVDILNNKIQGRKTNSESQKKYFPTDVSMDRVSSLENSFFDFGANK
jgi:hypothetical protein